LHREVTVREPCHSRRLSVIQGTDEMHGARMRMELERGQHRVVKRQVPVPWTIIGTDGFGEEGRDRREELARVIRGALISDNYAVVWLAVVLAEGVFVEFKADDTEGGGAYALVLDD
jgi:hypothetical protein